MDYRYANQKLDDNKFIVKKAFLVTGLSNSLGGYEDHLVRDDAARKEMDEIIVLNTYGFSAFR